MDMAKIASYPVFFNKNRVFRVYTGGKLFSDFFGDASEDSFYPEEWICSSTKALNEGSTDPFEGLSVVEGTDVHFDELLKTQKEKMLGERDGLDVLVKALDSAIRLPVQAHPDKPFSRKHFNSEFGKAESWYVLATRENACIYFGFREGVTREQFEAAVKDSEADKAAMERLLNRIPVKTGDVFFIPARAVHAIGYGCLILEVQEPTDFTIQPERWCGDYHLSDKEMYIGLEPHTALDCFDFEFGIDRVEALCRKTPAVIDKYDGVTHEALISDSDTPCFSVERLIINNSATKPLISPAVYVVTKGEGSLAIDGDEYSRKIKQGDYFFAPYSVNGKLTARSEGLLELVICKPPVK